MLCSVIKSHLDAINNGAVPNIETAWYYLCKDECIKAVNQAFDTYEKVLKEHLI